MTLQEAARAAFSDLVRDQTDDIADRDTMIEHMGNTIGDALDKMHIEVDRKTLSEACDAVYASVEAIGDVLA